MNSFIEIKAKWKSIEIISFNCGILLSKQQQKIVLMFNLNKKKIIETKKKIRSFLKIRMKIFEILCATQKYLTLPIGDDDDTRIVCNGFPLRSLCNKSLIFVLSTSQFD